MSPIGRSWRDGATLAALIMGLAVGRAALGHTESADEPQSQRFKAYQEQMRKDQSENPTLAIGAPIPDFSLRGIDGKVHALAEYQRSPILAIVFISNHCPASQLYEGRIKAIAKDYASKGVQVVAIAPNGPAAVGPSALNYTDVDDSFEAMKTRAEFRHFNFPYLYDGETQSASHRFGPQVTPHIFIFDRERKLRYEGRIDDRLQESRAKTRDARAALDALIAAKPVAVAHTPVFGCSTKWNSHAESAHAEAAQWQAEPVKLKMVSIDELRALRKNATGKMLLVNFWATWCGPCQSEYPKLLQTYQWYRSRDFELVSVSVNTPAEQPAVQKFLDKTHSAVQNLLVNTDDVYAVMAAFDPGWQAGVPFTMVIAPGGQAIYQHQGEVDILKLRRTILGELPDAGLFAGNAEYWRQ